MALVTMTATRRSARADIDANLVADLLWALAEPSHHLEHVHAKSVPGRVDLVLFHLTADAPAAATAARQLCRLAVSTSPRLRGWQVSSTVEEYC
nr:hypothetical protein [Kibdelosporangium sp. MJ126-NF4]CEL20151.1 hypothetical protein [Kibdelosporangium sp. MJ126-NF4]